MLSSTSSTTVPIPVGPCASDISLAIKLTSASPYCTTLRPNSVAKSPFLVAVNWLTRVHAGCWKQACHVWARHRTHLHRSGCSLHQVTWQCKGNVVNSFPGARFSRNTSIDVLPTSHQSGSFLHPSVKTQQLSPQPWYEDIILSMQQWSIRRWDFERTVE